MLDAYPHELSGGQRQRVGFAQALATRPRLILADEPVSMLDMSIRIGLLNLMAKLRDEEGVSILYITHDIASARYVADRLIVMYAGQIAESGPIEDVLAAPRHPYTQLLLSAVPDPKAPPPSLEAGRMATSAASRPRSSTPHRAAGSRPRCPVAIDTCATVTPLPLPLPADRAARWPAMSRRRGTEGDRMKLAVIGGGSTYTPELADGLGRLAPGSPSWSWSTRTRRGWPRSGRCRADHAPARAPGARCGGPPTPTTASTGPAAVLIQLRVGGQAARDRDETWPLDFCCVGQETTGAGGLAKALRTVPLVLEIAELAAPPGRAGRLAHRLHQPGRHRHPGAARRRAPRRRAVQRGDRAAALLRRAARRRTGVRRRWTTWGSTT